MKALRWTLVAAVGLLALSACFFTTTGEGVEGDLQIELEGSVITIPGVTHARVWLLSANNRITIGDGTDYLEIDLSQLEGNTVTVRGIPAGYEYVALFSVGIKHSGWFEVKAWGETDPVTVVSGVDTEVTFALGPSQTVPFTYGSAAVMGKNIMDVAVSGDIYAADATRMYSDGTGGVSALADDGVSLSGGRQINSLSLGTFSGPIWANTTQGIVRYTGAAYDYVSLLTQDTISVLDSGGYADGNQYVWYQRNGGLGGQDITDDDWLDIDVSDMVSGQPVKDMVVLDSTNFGYFATQLGGFALDRTILDSLSEDFLGQAVFFLDIQDGGAQYFVTSLAHDGANFYLGTSNGAYTSTNPVAVAATLVPGTGGHAFLEMEGAAATAAFLTQNYLFLRSGGTTYRLPFCAGLPGTVTGLAWDGATLVISGTEGVVEIPAATFIAQGLIVP